MSATLPAVPEEALDAAAEALREKWDPASLVDTALEGAWPHLYRAAVLDAARLLDLDFVDHPSAAEIIDAACGRLRYYADVAVQE